ncbi:MAG: HAD-IIA family hydrolase [Candidatus Anstonellales archaeon]
MEYKYRIKAFAFDGDGVAYVGDKLIKETINAIKALQRKGIAVYMATNTSSGTREQVYKRLKGIVDKENIITAADLMLEYIEKNYNYVWAISNPKIKRAINKLGIKINEHKAECVCISFHRRHEFNDIAIGLRLLLNKRPLLSANIDRYYLRPEGVVPGNGFITKAFESVVNVKAKYFGKPNPEMLFRIAKKENIKINELALVGDMMETDVQAAKNAGCLSIYVNNGVFQVIRVKPDIETSYKRLERDLFSLI